LRLRVCGKAGNEEGRWKGEAPVAGWSAGGGAGRREEGRAERLMGRSFRQLKERGGDGVRRGTCLG
jgi:hypothetical protein